MKIKWLGHACFLITSNSGIRILTDPFDHTVGYALPSVEADIVTTSHNHFDHNHVSVVKGGFVHIDKPDRYMEKGIEIIGVSTFHDESRGAKRGLNVVFKFDVDGVKVCHCGDLGHTLEPEHVKQIGEVDVLLVPVGGTYTVDARGAFEAVKQLNPSITIPMHFKTPAMNFPIAGVDSFLAIAGEGQKMNRQEVDIDGDSLVKLPKILVLDYE